MGNENDDIFNTPLTILPKGDDLIVLKDIISEIMKNLNKSKSKSCGPDSIPTENERADTAAKEATTEHRNDSTFFHRWPQKSS